MSDGYTDTSQYTSINICICVFLRMYRASSVLLIVVFMEDYLVLVVQYVHKHLRVLLQQETSSVYVPSINSIGLIVTFMKECTFSPSEMMFFYLL